MKRTFFIFLCAAIVSGKQLRAQTVTGSGTTNKIPKWTNGASSIIGDSQIQDNGTNVGIGGSGSYKLDLISGDVNIASGSSYRLGGSTFLTQNNIGTCIFIGPGIGNGSSGTNNSIIGVGSAGILSMGSNNTALGYNTLNGVQGANYNTAVGASSLRIAWSGSNTAVGYSALFSTTTGSHNTALGMETLHYNTGGSYNTATGSFSLYSTSTSSGNYNTANGAYSLYNNIGNVGSDGSYNVANGAYSLYSNTSGYKNTGGGYSSLHSNQTGNFNTALGFNSLYNTTASNNTALGYGAGTTISSGTDNTLIGYQADVSSSSLVKAIAIGSGATVATSSTMILGDNSVNVGIGYSGASLTANTKFDVLTTGASISGNTSSFGSHFINSNTGNGTAFPAAWALVYGAYGESNGSGNAYTYNYGGAFKATNAGRNVGMSAACIGPSTGVLAYAGYFNSSFSSSASSGNSYGVYSIVGSNGGQANIAIYGNAPSSSGNTLPNWAGYFSGDVYITGAGWIPGGTWNSSDRKFKTNIEGIRNPLEILKKLKPKTYYYDSTNADGICFPHEKQYGFIAQEVQQVMPEMVRMVNKPADIDANGNILHKSSSHLGVNYTNFIALLAAGIQQQQIVVDSLVTLTHRQDSINKTLQLQINQILKNLAESHSEPQNSNEINTQLFEANLIILNQNVPNPFAEQTVISYNIPESAGVAQIQFHGLNGQLIKTVDIVSKGAGKLNVFANDLSSGTYSYTLVVDGKIIDTKKMVKQ
jgi:trimeric autotransporter adhesin